MLVPQTGQCNNVLTGRIRYLKYDFHLVLKAFGINRNRRDVERKGLNIYLYYLRCGVLISNCLNAIYKN